MSKVELLSPAGCWDSLKAAVSEGADAVYFGVGVFNARRRAENFSEKELPEVVGCCHERGVRAYLAANTLVKNSELRDYFRLIESAYSAGVDAVIIQELSFLPIIKESFPGMGVHVSTQAGVFNSFYAKLLSGVDKVIMPRELSLKQVREFHEKTGFPVEIFVQGALCFSVSGQCLMSSFLGGRSGNRGLCAQPCRKRYNGRYLMSTRDLCLVEKLPEIVDAGVSSLKIEGRLRSPEYVGAATALYRRALDSIDEGKFKVNEEAMTDMELAYSREYTLGGLFKEYDITTPAACGKRGIRLGTLGKNGFMKLESEVKVGDGLGIFTGMGGHGDIVRRIDFEGKPVNSGRKGQNVRLFLNAKEGDEITVTSGAARRKQYNIKDKAKIMVERDSVKAKIPGIEPNGFSEPKLLVKTYSLEDAQSAADAGASIVYYNVFARDYPKGDDRISPYVPRCLSEWNAGKALELIGSIRPRHVLSGDLGVASELKDSVVHLDNSCNAFNDIDVGYFNSRSMIPVVSPELSEK
ncbi:MAG: U32 family peptidase, partial [Candidatus Altiarchaeota archaeon]|nr:U32 family peptidase [Candidatus Altiarchaeota archaeon]